MHFRSVLKPPIPVEEYLRDQKGRQLQVGGNQFDVHAITPPNIGNVQQQTMLSPQLPFIRDSESLRTLLPKAHKHLLGKQHNA